MRVVSVFAAAVALMVVLASMVSASSFTIPRHRIPKSAPVKPGQQRPHIVTAPGQPQPSASGASYGNTYNMLFSLGMALQTRNYTWVDSLIDDNAFLVVNAVQCGTMTKSEFLAAAKTAEGNTLATFFQIGSWAGVDDASVIARGTVAGIMGPNSPIANQTTVNRDIAFNAMPNEAGTQLLIFEQLQDLSWKNSNATQMAAVVAGMKDAARIRDVAGFANLLSDNMQGFQLMYAFNQFKPLFLNNKTAFVNFLSQGWAEQRNVNIDTDFTVVSCDFVVTSFIWSATQVNGDAGVMRYAMSTSIDPTMKVQYVSEWNMMPFTN